MPTTQARCGSTAIGDLFQRCLLFDVACCSTVLVVRWCSQLIMLALDGLDGDVPNTAAPRHRTGSMPCKLRPRLPGDLHMIGQADHAGAGGSALVSPGTAVEVDERRLDEVVNHSGRLLAQTEPTELHTRFGDPELPQGDGSAWGDQGNFSGYVSSGQPIGCIDENALTGDALGQVIAVAGAELHVVTGAHQADPAPPFSVPGLRMID